jgi:hypothetical protein
MILINHLEHTQFVALSRIVNDVCYEFSINHFVLYDMINDQAPWTWGDTNRVMVGNVEFVEFLDELLAQLGVSAFDVDTYCTGLRDFLTTQNAYVDIAN